MSTNTPLKPPGLPILLWLFFRPTRWRTLIQQIDSSLSPLFCLAELRPAQWQNPQLQQLLFTGFGVAPLLVATALSLGLWSVDRLSWFALTGLAFGTLLGFALSFTVSFAAGLAVSVGAGIVFGLAWSTPQPLLIDALQGASWALGFGLTSALLLHITANLTESGRPHSSARRIGSFVIGFVASLIIAGLALANFLLIVQTRLSGLLSDQGINLQISGLLGGLIGVALGFRTANWRRALLLAPGIMLFFYTLLGNAATELGQNASGPTFLQAVSLLMLVTYVTLCVLPYVLLERLLGAWAGAVAGALSGLAVLAITGAQIVFFNAWLNLSVAGTLYLAGLTMKWWRPLLSYPLQAAWNTVLYRIDDARNQRPTLLRYNAAFWDELQFLPLYGLEDHLLLLFAHDPLAGQLALAEISIGPQRWAARAVQIELDARRLAGCDTIEKIAECHHTLAVGELEGATSAILRRFSSLSNDVAVGLTQMSSYNQRLVLVAAENDLAELLLDLTRSGVAELQRFRPIVNQWRQIVVERVHDLSLAAEARQEIQNPYIVGVPLTKHQEIFVGRSDVSARIEQLLQDNNHPPLLLYGQRRMGKTSLLYSLRWLLPHRILPLVVDLQGPVALASDHASFLYNLAKAMYISAQQQGLSVTQLTRQTLAQDPFTHFDDWLDSVESALLTQGRTTILLALDEFEALDSALIKGRLSDEAILGTLRHMIQHRTAFKLLLAGSHTLDEFGRWSSYLINAQTLHLSYLKASEARQLIERPIKDFALSYAAAASQHVFDLTRGHPYLVQLLCSEIISYKNQQPIPLRRLATVDDVECAVPHMLNHGRQFFADIALNQVDPDGRTLLQILARLTEDQPVSTVQLLAHVAEQHQQSGEQLAATLDQLVRRELIEEVNQTLRFQVEAIRRWFAQ